MGLFLFDWAAFSDKRMRKVDVAVTKCSMANKIGSISSFPVEYVLNELYSFHGSKQCYVDS